VDTKKKFPAGILILCILVIIFIGVAAYRFINGIGAASGMSDGRPWGIWISFDLYCGVALASGGFTLAAIVYVFMREKYHAVIRPAILTALLGYLLVILALLVDLGQPWYIWHFFIFWNIHSPMFEVALCVMTYTFVLLLEFSPVIFEALKKWNFPIVRNIKWEIPLKIVRRIQIPVVITGIVLSTLHQSSLGSMLLIMPETLHPLWYTPVLPIFFYISAIAVGPAMVLFEATLSNKAFGDKLDIDIYRGLTKIFTWTLGIYLVCKLADLIIAGEIGLLFTSGHYSLLWWGEMLIGVLLPIVILLFPGTRKSKTAMFWCSTLVVLGLIFNRFNVSMLALQMRPGYTYFPSWMEVSISVGLVSFGILFIWLAHRYLPMHETKEIPAPEIKQ
jgi:Ni/Fe-hydrogenase subunit HybB-like protein